MIDRFVIRPDATGYSVVDLWNGKLATVAMTAQSGLPKTDAEHIADLLNQRAATDGRATRPEPRAAKA